MINHKYNIIGSGFRGLLVVVPKLRGGELYKYRLARRGKNMKYMLYWELCPEDLDKIIPLFQKMGELRDTKDYPTLLAPVYNFAGQTSGFTIYEVDDPQQITNFYFHYHPLLKLKWKPIEETTNTIATYMKKKKG